MLMLGTNHPKQDNQNEEGSSEHEITKRTNSFRSGEVNYTSDNVIPASKKHGMSNF